MRRYLLLILSYVCAIPLFAELNDVELDEVMVTEGKQDRLKSSTSLFDTETITADGLCRAACCNLSESFENDPSVDVSFSDAATGARTIHLLGLEGSYIQLMHENTPGVRGLAQNFGMEFIPGPWMQSIQVSKGASSVRNGYEAVTGQINVEFLKPQIQDPLSVNVMLNSELHAEANLTGGWRISALPSSKGRLYTGVMAHYQNGSLIMDHNNDSFVDMPKNQNLNLVNRWFFSKDSYILQAFVRGVYDERKAGQLGKDIADPYRIELGNRRVDGYVKNGVIIDEERDMSVGIILAASYHDLDDRYGLTEWRASQTNAYLNAIFESSFGEREEHKLSTGLSVNYDNYRENLALEPLPGSINDYNLDRWEIVPGMFAEYTYKYEDKLSLVAGLRLDWSNLHGLFATPRMNVRYNPFEWWTIRASAGMGYRSVNVVADNAGYLPSARNWYNIKGVSDMLERAVNTGASMSFDIPIGSRSLKLSGEYYYTRFIDCLVADADRATDQICFYGLSMVDGAMSYAHSVQTEATMEILRGWTVTAAFRYTDVKQTTFNSEDNAYELRDKVLQSRFKGLLTTTYKTPLKKWQFDFTAQFNGPARMPDGFTDYFMDLLQSDQYYVSNGSLYHRWYPQLMAQITKNFRHWSIYVGAENMSNFCQKNPIVGASEPFGKGFDASMSWGPVSGWKVYAGMRWSLARKDD